MPNVGGRGGGVACALLCLVAGGAAGGAPRELDGDGFRLDLDIAPRCVILPRALQAAEQCPGLDVRQLADAADAQVQAHSGEGSKLLAFVQWTLPDGEVAIMQAISAPPMEPTSSHVSDMLAGLYDSLHPGDHVARRNDPRLAHDTISAGGAPAIRYVTPMNAPGAHSMVAYFLFGSTHVYALTFFGADEAATRALAERVIATVALQPMAATVGTAPAGRVGTYDAGYLLGSLLGGLVVIGVITRLIRRKLAGTVKAAFIAAGIGGAIGMGIGSLTMGPARASVYLVCAGAWLVFDLARAARPDAARSGS